MSNSLAVTVTHSLQSQEWYQALIEDCAAVITEGVFQSRWILIETYHLLGRRLLQEYANFNRAEIYGDRITEMVAADLGKSQRTIQRAVQFAQKFPDLGALPDGKNITWHKICNQLLPIPKDGSASPIVYYNGLATLANLHGPRGRLWTVELPSGTELEGKAGDEVHVIIREKP